MERFIAKRVCFHVIMVFAIALFLSTISWAGTFKDNFNDGNADGWKIEENGAGKWQVKNGGYNGSIASGVESIALVGEADWEVDSIEVKVRDVQGSWLAIVFRYQDINNFDSWWLNIPSKTLEAWPKVGNYEGAAKATGIVPFDPAKEFTIKVLIEKNNFTVFFDGKKISEYSNDKFKTGRVGLLVWEGSTTFDDVVIEGKNVSGLMVVSPYKKQLSIWGLIKQQYIK